MSRRTKGLYLLVTVLTIGAAVATFFSLDKALEKSNVEVKASIDESVQTQVESNAMGAHHLVDKVSGEELTVRSDGDTFVTTSRIDALTSRKLNCIAISDVAKLVNDVATATPGSLVIKDIDGVEKEIIPIGSIYKDDQTVLEFGSFQVIMDSDACNSASGAPSIIDIEPALYASAEKDGDDVSDDEADDDINENDDASDEEEGSDVFKRRLRKPSPSIKSSPTSSSMAVASQSTVIARHRQEFTKARVAIQEGRHLTGDSPFVPVQTAGGGSSGTAGYAAHLGQGRCVDGGGRYYDRIYRGGTFYNGQYFNAKTCAHWCHNDVDTSSTKEDLRGFQLQYKTGGNVLCLCLFDNGQLPSTPSGAILNENFGGSGRMRVNTIYPNSPNDCYKYVSLVSIYL